ncbi:MAG: RcpC/CpaB family pilus assembly protein [Candidatus Nanopelagicales bacterium]
MRMVERGSSAVPRLLRRNRRALAGLAVAMSVLAMGAALRPPDAATVPVVVAAEDLPAGHRLTREDLLVAQVARGILPTGAQSDTAPLAGKVLAAPVGHGEVIGTSRLATPAAFSLGAGAGSTPTPVRFTDAGAAQLLAPGQLIDVLAARSMVSADGDEGTGLVAAAHVVAAGVLVLAVIDPAERSGLMGAGSQSGGGPVVVLDLTRDQALAVVGSQATAQLSFTLLPDPHG